MCESCATLRRGATRRYYYGSLLITNFQFLIEVSTLLLLFFAWKKIACDICRTVIVGKEAILVSTTIGGHYLNKKSGVD